jgi:glycerophosphoryl diester phosphodiesterase
MNYREQPGPLAIAHRGGAGLAAENTMEAFRRSYHLGVRYLETDVRLSADGQLVIFHDASLNRVTAVGGSMGDRTLPELIQLPVLGGGTIPSLASVLAAFPRACFTLDVKEPAVVGPLAELLQARGLSGRVCVAAARGQWLHELRARLGPDLCTALSWRDLAHLAARPRGNYGAAGFAHIPLRLGRVPVFREELVGRAHAAGVRAIVWTVNEPNTMHRLLDAGVDGIITDRPDLLRDVMISRGQWHTPEADRAPCQSPVVS